MTMHPARLLTAAAGTALAVAVTLAAPHRPAVELRTVTPATAAHPVAVEIHQAPSTTTTTPAPTTTAPTPVPESPVSEPAAYDPCARDGIDCPPLDLVPLPPSLGDQPLSQHAALVAALDAGQTSSNYQPDTATPTTEEPSP